MQTRRFYLAGIAASVLATVAQAARAAVDPLLVYADGLVPGWWIGGWSKTTPSFPFADGSKPIEVNMAGWNVMTFQTSTPIDTSKYTTLIIVTHGGEKGKQEFMLSAKLGEKVVSQEMSISCVKGEWAKILVPLKKMKIKGPIDTLALSNKSADAMPTFYINYVLFQ